MKSLYATAILFILLNSVKAQSFDTLQTILIPGHYAVGVVFDKSTNEYIMTSAGVLSNFDDQVFLRIDLNGNIVGTFPQGNSAILGFRDMITDGNFLYSSHTKDIIKVDKISFLPLDTFPGVIGTCRGLTMESDGTFWESNSNTESLVHLDREGNNLGSCAATSFASEPPYGIALDTISIPGEKWLWMATPAPANNTPYGVHLTRFDLSTCTIDTVIDLTTKAPEYAGTLASAGYPAGLDIMKDHPLYPGKTLILYVGRKNGGNSYISLIDITRSGSSIDNNTAAVNLEVFPNPLSGNEIHFKGLPQNTGSLQFVLSNQLGQKVSSSAVNSSRILLNRQQLSSGIYYYQLMKGSDVIAGGKITLE